MDKNTATESIYHDHYIMMHVWVVYMVMFRSLFKLTVFVKVSSRLLLISSILILTLLLFSILYLIQKAGQCEQLNCDRLNTQIYKCVCFCDVTRTMNSKHVIPCCIKTLRSVLFPHF